MEGHEVARRIVLARHGQTEWNVEHRFQGDTDTPLTDAGVEQARALADRLSSWPLEAVWSSPLDRALRTASLVAERHGLRPTILQDLHEVGFGEWEGLSIQRLEMEGGDDLLRWREDPFFAPPPGGEGWDEIHDRLSRAVGTILAGPHRRIAVVSHGGIMRALYAILVGLDPHKTWDMDVSNCAMSGVEIRDGRTRLAFANDDMHVRAGEAGRRLPVW